MFFEHFQGVFVYAELQHLGKIKKPLTVSCRMGLPSNVIRQGLYPFTHDRHLSIEIIFPMLLGK